MGILCRLLALSAVSLSAKEFHVIALQDNPHIGMFAAANQVLGQLSLFEADQLGDVSGLTVDFDKYGAYYDPEYGPNWWTYYFEPLEVGRKDDAHIVRPTLPQYTNAWMHRRTLSKMTAAEIVKRHIHVRPHIQQKADAFIRTFFEGHFVIGVHYRGTDKKSEAPRVPYSNVFEAIDQHLPKDQSYRIFTATDEVEFLQQMKERYPHHVIETGAERSRSEGDGVHFLPLNKHKIGEEAIIDALLLSKCNLLIRTSSNLSLWSTYFNPDLPVILLSRRNGKTTEPE